MALLSSAYSKRKLPISVITIDDDEEDFLPFLKREKNEDPSSLCVVNFIGIDENGENKLNSNDSESLFEPLTSTGDNNGEIKFEMDDDIEAEAQTPSTNNKSLTADFSGSESPTPVESEIISPFFNIHIIKAPNFEVEIKDGIKYLIVVFDAINKDLCYNFRRKRDNLYICVECKGKHKRSLVAKLLKNENGEDYIEMKNGHVCNPVKYIPFQQPKMEIINPPNFEIQKELNGKEKLVIFVTTNPNLCYYYTNHKENYFGCIECRKNHGRNIIASLLKDDDGNDEYIEANMKHLCEPQKYSSTPMVDIAPKLKIIKPANFEIEDENRSQILTIFIEDGNSLCYKFSYFKLYATFFCKTCKYYHKKLVSAKILKSKEDGNQYVQMDDNHLCKPLPYMAGYFPISCEMQIIKAPNFQTYSRINDEAMELVIFYPKNPDLCFLYFYQTEKNVYLCRECFDKNKCVAAKLLKDEKGAEYLRADMNHFCEPEKYISISSLSKVIKSPNFNIEMGTDSSKRLIIFMENGSSLCYKFYYSKSLSMFLCESCKYRHKSLVRAKLFKNEEDGEKNVRMENNHRCSPIPYMLGWPTLCDRQIIKTPNYEIFTKINEAEELIVFDSNNSKLCYHYFYQADKNIFTCSQCFCEKNKRVSAKLLKDEKGDEYLRANMSHFCKPIEYDITESFKVLNPPHFTFIRNGFDDSIVTLIIYASNDQKMYYKYVPMGNFFVCSGCLSKKKRVTAKIHNFYEVLVYKFQTHICFPFYSYI